MRVGEIIGDFRIIMQHISSVNLVPSPDEANEDGYVLYRQLRTSAQTLLAQPFRAMTESGQDDEQQKVALRRYD